MTNNNTYKQTSIGLIPKDWEVKKLGDICLVKGDYGINAAATNFRPDLPVYLRITDINEDGLFSPSKKSSVNDISSSNFFLSKNDIVFVRTGATTGKTYLYNEKDGTLVFAGFLIRFKVDINQVNDYYLWSYTNSKPYWDWVKMVSMRSGQPGINSTEYASLQIPIPPLEEQEKIAKILSTWDKAIYKYKEVIENLRQCKKGLTQEVLLGKIRFSETQNNPLVKNRGFVIPKDWKVAPISKLVKQVKKSVTPEPDTLYSQIGIRSHAKGIFYKEAVTGLSLGNKSVFEIEPNCFIVNIVFAWEHAIAKTTINEVGMIASHRFPMYKPLENELDLDYMLHFFKSKKGKELLGIASPGGAGRNKTLGQSEFLKLSIPVPPLAEQKRIAEFLDKIDTEIIVHQQKLAHLQNQKKGLMQQLLTGKVRVKI